MEARFHAGVAAAAFRQRFVDGAVNASTGDRRCDIKHMPWIGCDWKGVVSAFPSFSLPQDGNLGWLAFYGEHLNDAHNETHRGPRVGRWRRGEAVADGLLAGPLAIFDQWGSSLVLSPLTNPMAASIAQSQDGSVSWGVMGGVMDVPKGYTISHIVQGGEGINQAFDKWGTLMLGYYGNPRKKTRVPPGMGGAVETHLGYETDNGAYYYYNPMKSTDMGGTLDVLGRYFEQEQLPVRWANLDSWRYFKGPGTTGGEGVPMAGGAKNWSTDPEMVNDVEKGLYNLRVSYRWDYMAHNRWWQNVTDYAIENGGKFPFLLESESKAYPGNGFALPQGEEFWNFIMEYGQQWGLTLYEQDWLWVQFLGMEATTRSVDAAQQWLDELTHAALTHNVTVQYCMSLPRHAIQTAMAPAVTQIRTSDDYGPGERDGQWRIGRSSLLASALGLASYKDEFLTTNQNETGGRLKGPEPFPRLQAAVATYSLGPVGFADGIQFINKTLLMRSANAQGEILKPDMPLVALERAYLDEVFNGLGRGDWPSGASRAEIWASKTMIGEKQWLHVLAADIGEHQRPTSVRELLHAVSSSPLPSESAAAEYILFERPVDSFVFAPSEIRMTRVSLDTPIELPPVALPLFRLLHIAPAPAAVPASARAAAEKDEKAAAPAFVLLGELDKWVPISAQRIVRVDGDSHGGMSVTVRGAPGEVVGLSFAKEEEEEDEEATTTGSGSTRLLLSLVSVQCAVGPAGTVVMTVPDASCTQQQQGYR